MTGTLHRREFIRKTISGAAAFAFTFEVSCGKSDRQEYVSTKEKEQKLNFIYFLIDDLGWTDVACYGSTFYETPNIDKLASQGMKFTDAYAACPVCSPTRASILTGKYPARLHLTDWITGHVNPTSKLRVPDWKMYLDHDEVTLAEALKTAGYISASIGKWHLGGEDYFPEKQGFDVNIAGYSAGQPPTYFYPYERPDRNLNTRIPTMQGGKEGEYLTDRLADEALEFIDEQKDNPFFLYLSHYAVHTPIEGKKEITEKYRGKIQPENPQQNPEYAAMIESVDESVGRVMAKINELGIADRTVVIFMSDNGGLIGEGRFQGVTSNLPLRNGKGTPYEGGVREPMIIRWPGVVRPGSVCNETVTSIDFYPTILEMAGVDGDPNHIVDGVSIVPLLQETGRIDRDAVYWHYPHYHPLGSTPFGSIRKGDFKLIEFYEDFRVELYNLKEDIGEKDNLAEKMPEKANELRKMLHDWRKSVRAQMPTPNPDYREE